MINLKNENGKIYCNSRMIGNDFEKKHNKILRTIDEIHEKFNNSNESKSGFVDYFIESSYKDAKNETRKCFDMSQDGFNLLVMGFTGQKAFDWKIKYINEFNRMKLELDNIKEEKIQSEKERLNNDKINIEKTSMELTHSEKIHITKTILYPILDDIGVYRIHRKLVHTKLYKALTSGSWENINRYDGINIELFKQQYKEYADGFKMNNPQYFINSGNQTSFL